MKKLFLFVALALCGIQSNYSNSNDPETALGSISGTVVDNALQQPVAYAAIVIKSENGTETITGGITEDDGSFEIKKLPDGTFVLEVQFIGYKTYSQELIISKNRFGDHHLGRGNPGTGRSGSGGRAHHH